MTTRQIRDYAVKEATVFGLYDTARTQDLGQGAITGAVASAIPFAGAVGGRAAERFARYREETKGEFAKIFSRDKKSESKVETIEAELINRNSGLTTENQGVVSKIINSEESLLKTNEKEALLKVDPKLFKKYREVVTNREKSFDNPTLHETAIKDVQKVIDEYGKVNLKAGQTVGLAKNKMDKSIYNG
jgi:hypothetical protein